MDVVGATPPTPALKIAALFGIGLALGFVRPESEVKGELSAAPTKSQGPNWLRITSQVLPAAVSFLHNLSSGARLSSAMVMM